jgi:Rrf2 family protein
MNTNQQFSVSCHILTLLAAYPDELITSEAIAASVDTHPVVIRRIMAHLRQHGLVESHPGVNGGWRLTRPASQLRLGEVYQVVSHENVLAMHQHPDPDCPIGGFIQIALGRVFGDAQSAFEQALDKFSVKNLLEDTIRAGSQPPKSEKENYD